MSTTPRDFSLMASLCLCLAWPGVALAQTQADCTKAFSLKEYQIAATCFIKLAKASKGSDSKARLQRSILLQNAANSLGLLAGQMKIPLQAQVHRLRAIALLHPMRLEKRCVTSANCQQIKRQRKALEAQLGLATLILRPKLGKTRLCITHKSQPILEAMLQKPWGATLGPWARKYCYTGLKVTLHLLPGVYPTRFVLPGKSPLTLKKKFTLERGASLDWSMPKIPFKLYGPPAEVALSLVGYRHNSSTRFKGQFEAQLWPGNYDLVLKPPTGPALKKRIQITLDHEAAERRPVYHVLQISSSTPGAGVLLNGVYRGATPLYWLTAARTSLDIAVQKRCFLPARSKLYVPPAAQSPLQIALKRDPVWSRSTKGSSRLALLGWIGLGAGVLVGGVAAVFYGLAEASHADALPNRLSNYNLYKTKAEEGNTFRISAHVGLGVAAVAMGVGLVALLAGRPPKESGLACQIRKTPKGG